MLDGITASDTPADLSRALGAAADALRDRKNPLIVLISDGAFPRRSSGSSIGTRHRRVRRCPARGLARDGSLAQNLAAVDLSGIDVRYVPVGKRGDNVGIVAFNVRRYIANKAAYEVFIEIQNFGQEPAKRTLSLQNGDIPVETRTSSCTRPARASHLREAAGDRRQPVARCAQAVRRSRRPRRKGQQ